MLLAFEGTGMQATGKRTDWHTPNHSWGWKSFVLKFYKRSADPNNSKYFPGPDKWGTNCNDILVDAIKFYNERLRLGLTPQTTKIFLCGYSRGAYIAMSFATYLKKRNIKVDFLGLFDAVSMDDSIPDDLSTRIIPNNVKVCYHAARSPLIGSRSVTMDHCGKTYEGASSYPYIELPGSHASMGGFPNDSGFGDGPNSGQGDPKRPSYFHPQKELTAWWLAANHISQAALRHGVITKPILEAKEKPDLMPQKDWYTPQLMYGTK